MKVYVICLCSRDPWEELGAPATSRTPIEVVADEATAHARTAQPVRDGLDSWLEFVEFEVDGGRNPGGAS